MDFKGINELDLKLLLLSGSKIQVDNLEISPYTLEEIKDYGYTKYIQNLQWISISIDDFINSIVEEEKKNFLENQKANLKVFDFYIKLGGQELQDSLLSALSMIFKTNDVTILDSVVALNFEKMGLIIRNEDGGLTVNEEKLNSISEDEIKIVHRDNFDDIVNVIKFQNYLEKPKSKKEENINPADEETRLLQEHMKRMREKVEAKKRRQQQDDNGGEIDIYDIIDAVSSKSQTINKLNVWQLNLYQLYSEYARLELFDNYDFSIKAMLAGAEKIDLKHWSSKL